MPAHFRHLLFQLQVVWYGQYSRAVFNQEQVMVACVGYMILYSRSKSFPTHLTQMSAKGIVAVIKCKILDQIMELFPRFFMQVFSSVQNALKKILPTYFLVRPLKKLLSRQCVNCKECHLLPFSLLESQNLLKRQ